MIPQDKANAFNSALLKTEGMLQKLQRIDIDTKMIKQKIKKIKEKKYERKRQTTQSII